MLQVRRLQKRFGDLVVTDDVDLSVTAGDIHAIIGPNGAGKTTLLHLIGGQILSDSGEIELDGRDVTRWPAFRRARIGIARTFQVNSFFPSFSVEENVRLGVRAAAGQAYRVMQAAGATARVDERTTDILERTRLSHRAQQPAEYLPYGELRRLEIAIALSSDPLLLLLDEPSAGMTRADSSDLVMLLQGLPASIGVILIEHDMDVVHAIARRITVLDRGKVIASGDPESISSDAEVRRVYLGPT